MKTFTVTTDTSAGGQSFVQIDNNDEHTVTFITAEDALVLIGDLLANASLILNPNALAETLLTVLAAVGGADAAR